MYMGYPVAGREWNDMGRKKEPQTNKTKKPRTSYTKRPSIWQESSDILSGDISVQQQMLFWVLNQPGTVQLQIVTNETNSGTWRSSRNRLLCTVPKFTSLPSGSAFNLWLHLKQIHHFLLHALCLTGFARLCELPDQAAWHRQAPFASQLVRDYSNSYISPMAWN